MTQERDTRRVWGPGGQRKGCGPQAWARGAGVHGGRGVGQGARRAACLGDSLWSQTPAAEHVQGWLWTRACVLSRTPGHTCRKHEKQSCP